MDRSKAAEDIRKLAEADERLPEAVVKAFDDAMRSSGRSVQSVFDALALPEASGPGALIALSPSCCQLALNAQLPTSRRTPPMPSCAAAACACQHNICRSLTAACLWHRRHGYDHDPVRCKLMRTLAAAHTRQAQKPAQAWQAKSVAAHCFWGHVLAIA